MESVDNWRFNIRVNRNRDQIIRNIFKENLFASTHYNPVDVIFETEVLGS